MKKILLSLLAVNLAMPMEGRQALIQTKHVQVKKEEPKKSLFGSFKDKVSSAGSAIARGAKGAKDSISSKWNNSKYAKKADELRKQFNYAVSIDDGKKLNELLQITGKYAKDARKDSTLANKETFTTLYGEIKQAVEPFNQLEEFNQQAKKTKGNQLGVLAQKVRNYQKNNKKYMSGALNSAFRELAFEIDKTYAYHASKKQQARRA